MSSNPNSNGKRPRLQDRDPNVSMKYRKVASKNTTQPQERSTHKCSTSTEEAIKQRETSLATDEQLDHDDEETLTVNAAVTSKSSTGRGASPAGPSRNQHVGNDRPIATPRRRLPASPLSQVHNLESDNDAATVNIAARRATTAAAAAPKKKPARILLPDDEAKPKKQAQPKKRKAAPKPAAKIAGALKQFSSKAARDKYENERMAHAHDISGNITLPDFKRYGTGSVESAIGPSTLVKPKVPEPIKVPENKNWLQEYLDEQKKRVEENAEQDEFNQPKEVVASKMAALGNLTAMMSSSPSPDSPKQPSTPKQTAATNVAQSPKQQQAATKNPAPVSNTARISTKQAEVSTTQQKPNVDAYNGTTAESPEKNLSFDQQNATAEAAKQTTKVSPSKSSEEIANGAASGTRDFVEKSSLKGFKAKFVKIPKKPVEAPETEAKASSPTGVSRKDFARVPGSEDAGQKSVMPEKTQLSQKEKEGQIDKVSEGLKGGNKSAPPSDRTQPQPKESFKESTNTATKQLKATGSELDSNASTLKKAAQSLTGIPQKQHKAVGGETTSSTMIYKKSAQAPSATIQEQQQSAPDTSDPKTTHNASKPTKNISEPKSSSSTITATSAVNRSKPKSKRMHDDSQPENDTQETNPKKRSKTKADDRLDGSDTIADPQTTTAVGSSQKKTPEPMSSKIANTATSPKVTNSQTPETKSKRTIDDASEPEAESKDSPPKKRNKTEAANQHKESNTFTDPKTTPGPKNPKTVTTSAPPAANRGESPDTPPAKSKRKLSAAESKEPITENDRPKKRSKVEEVHESSSEESSDEDDDDDVLDPQVAKAEALARLKAARAAKATRAVSTPTVGNPLRSPDPAPKVSNEVESAAPEEAQPESEIDSEADDNEEVEDDEPNEPISTIPLRSTISTSRDSSLAPGSPTEASSDIKPKKGIARKTDPKAREADRKRHERRTAAKKVVGNEEKAKQRAKRFIMD